MAAIIESLLTQRRCGIQEGKIADPEQSPALLRRGYRRRLEAEEILRVQIQETARERADR